MSGRTWNQRMPDACPYSRQRTVYICPWIWIQRCPAPVSTCSADRSNRLSPSRSHFSPLLRQVSNLLSLAIYSHCRREQTVCTSVIMWLVDSYYKQGDMTSSLKTILKQQSTTDQTLCSVNVAHLNVLCGILYSAIPGVLCEYISSPSTY